MFLGIRSFREILLQWLHIANDVVSSPPEFINLHILPIYSSFSSLRSSKVLPEKFSLSNPAQTWRKTLEHEIFSRKLWGVLSGWTMGVRMWRRPRVRRLVFLRLFQATPIPDTGANLRRFYISRHVFLFFSEGWGDFANMVVDFDCIRWRSELLVLRQILVILLYLWCRLLPFNSELSFDPWL